MYGRDEEKGEVGVEKGLHQGWVVVLGYAQDGGVPQLGCRCPRCQQAHLSGRIHTASLAIISKHGDDVHSLVIDTGPDFRTQYEETLDLLARQPGSLAEALQQRRKGPNPVDAVLLTHLHMGHFTGLLELGLEVVNGRDIPLYCTAPVAQFLAENAPWSQLLERNNVLPHVIRPGEVFAPAPGLTAEAYPVPHRNEYGDTVGFRIALRGGKSLLYIPDADSWDEMEPPLVQLVNEADYALLDGTFFSAHELGGREQSQVPHPPVKETANLLASRASHVFFTHLNHTNPLLDTTSHQRQWLEAQGFSVLFARQVLDLNPIR